MTRSPTASSSPSSQLRPSLDRRAQSGTITGKIHEPRPGGSASILLTDLDKKARSPENDIRLNREWRVNQDGSFTIGPLPYGRYRLELRQELEFDRERPVLQDFPFTIWNDDFGLVKKTDVAPTTITLDRARVELAQPLEATWIETAKELHGTVLRDGKPAAKALVFATRPGVTPESLGMMSAASTPLPRSTGGKGVWLTARSDAQGRFCFRYTQAGDWLLRALGPGDSASGKAAMVTLAPGKDSPELCVELGTARVTGRLTAQQEVDGAFDRAARHEVVEGPQARSSAASEEAHLDPSGHRVAA